MYRCNACTSVWLLVAFCLFLFSRWLGGRCLLERAWNGCICIGGGGGDRLLEVGGWKSGAHRQLCMMRTSLVLHVGNDRWLDSLFANMFALYHQCSMRIELKCCDMAPCSHAWRLATRIECTADAPCTCTIYTDVSLFPFTIFKSSFYI